MILIVRSILVTGFCILQVSCGVERAGSEFDTVVAAQVMDSMLTSHYEADGPGGAMVVRRGQSVIYQAAVGLADLETGRPLTVETPFYIASIAKPITASAIELLVGEDRLRLSDTLGSLVPNLQSYADVNIYQLLSHTSGIPDYFDYVSFRELQMLDNQSVIDSLERHGLNIQARTSGYFYSNSNYVLLAEIASRIAGRSFAMLLAEQVFDPLELEDVVVDDAAEPHPSAARAYMPLEDSFRISEYEFVELPGGITGSFDFRTTGAGGLYMSAVDLAKWLSSWMARPGAIRQALDSPQGLVMVDSLTSAVGIGTVGGYANGWFNSQLEGYTVHWHDGNRGGFNACVAAVPDLDLAIVVLANRGDIQTTPIVEAALTWVLTQTSDP